MSRRWRGVGQRRGTFLDVPPQAAAPAAPSFPPGFISPEGLRGRQRFTVRRGRFIEPPWTPVGPPPAITEPARRARPSVARRGDYFTVPPLQLPPPVPARTSRRASGFLARRGRFLAVPVAVAAPAAPATVPGFSRTRTRPPVGARRGRWYGPTWEPPFQPTVYVVGAASPVASRVKPRPTRRGERFEPPWAAVAAAPAVWIPPLARAARRWPLRARRGERFEPPWPQVAAQPDVWRPQFTRATLRLAGRPVRRGQHFEPPWAQGPQTVWLPSFTRATLRLAGRPTRRGAYAEPPWPQAAQPGAPAWVPALTGRRRPTTAAARRGRYQWTPPAPAGVPGFLRRRRPFGCPARSGRYAEPPWVQGPQTVWRPAFRGQAGARPRFAAKLRRGCLFVVPPPPITTPPPRWVESAAGGVSVTEGAAGGVAITEGGTGGISLTEGGTGV